LINRRVFGEGGQQVLGGRPALNEMVSHDRVDYILGPPFGHVAIDAAGIRGVPTRRDSGTQRFGVALAADAVVVLAGALAAGDVVRIMAGGAGHLASAAQEALRFAKAVSGVGNLEVA